MSEIKYHYHPIASLSPIERLPIELIEELLLLLPDCYSLGSAVLAAFVFYEAYIHRRGSILFTVCRHENGRVWPYALALVKAQLANEEQRGSDLFADELLDLDRLGLDRVGDIHSLSLQEANKLVRVSSVARRLEYCYATR